MPFLPYYVRRITSKSFFVGKVTRFTVAYKEKGKNVAQSLLLDRVDFEFANVGSSCSFYEQLGSEATGKIDDDFFSKSLCRRINLKTMLFLITQ